MQIPEALRSLRLSGNFNQHLSALRLSATLTDLRFGHHFNKPMPPLEHTALQSLDMSGQRKWQQSIVDVRFPRSLYTLVVPPRKKIR